MTDRIDVVVQETGTDKVIQSFERLEQTARRTNTSVKALQKAFGNMGRSTAAATRVTALGTAAQGATGHVNNLNSAMTALNNTRVTANLNSANNALNNTGPAASRAATGVRDLVGAWLSFQAIKGVIQNLAEAQIQMQQIHYGLLAATGSAQKAGEEFEYLSRNANTLGLDLKTSAMEYTRLAASASAMNVATEDQQKLYTALSQASTVLHLDQQKVQFATLALTQMFSKGKIQAEELRRQLGEAIPGANVRFQKAVMEVVKGTDLAKYSFEDLMKRGLLDTKKFLPQLTQALSETGRGWEEAAGGLNAELNRLTTAWFKLKVAVTDGMFTDVMIASVRFLSKNLEQLTGIAIGLGVAISIALAPAAIIKFIGYVRMLGVAIYAAAGPWGLVIGAIVGVIGYLVSMREELKLSSDSLASLGDFAVVAWNDIKKIFIGLGDAIKWVWDNIDMIVPQVGIAFAILKALFGEYKLAALDAFDDIKQSNDSTWMKVLKGTARTIDAIVGLLIGMAGVSVEVFTEAAKFILQGLSRSADAMKALFSGDFAGFTQLLKDNASEVSNIFGRLGDAAGRAFDNGFGIVANYGLEAHVNKWQAEAEKAALFKGVTGRVVADIPTTGTDPSGGGGGKGKKDREMERLADQLNRLLGSLDPTEEAMKKLADAQKILNDVAAKGTPQMKALVAQMGGADVIMARLAEKYKDALKPVEALNDKYDRELASLRAITPEQKATVLSQEAMNEARKKGYDAATQAALGEATYRRELEKTRAQQLANAESQVYNNSSIEKARGATDTARGIISQQRQGNIGGGEAAVGMKNAYGIDPGIMDSYKAEQEQYAAHLESMRTLREEYATMAAESDGTHRDQYLAAEDAMNQTIAAMQTQRIQSTLNLASGMLDQVSQLMGSHNKKLFKIGQAAAIAKAGIDTASAVIRAGADWGYPWAIPFQAIAIALGAAQISQIRSQQAPSFRTGGSYTVGGSGGIDSQLVQFNASPGEHISINTPAEARAMQDLRDSLEDGHGRRSVVNQNVTIVQQGRPNNRTADQQARKLRKETMKEVGDGIYGAT